MSYPQPSPLECYVWARKLFCSRLRARTLAGASTRRELGGRYEITLQLQVRRDLYGLSDRVACIEGMLTGPWRPPANGGLSNPVELSAASSEIP